MYDASVVLYFSAAHFLNDYPGNCARMHGHNWKVKVTVRAAELDELGFVIDFREMKKEAKKILDELDHNLINDHKDFNNINPSSENIARWLFDKLKSKVENERCSLYSVEVGETKNSSVIYYGEAD